MSVSKQFIRGFVSLLVLSLFVMNVFSQVDETTATMAISKAENDLASAYEAVLEAENVEANVSGLLVRLNEAGGFLADAKMCYRIENFSGAVYFAGLASVSLSGLEGEAVELANSAAVEHGQKLSWTVTGSFFGVFLAVFVGFLGWGFVRKRYVRKVLKMKPEVLKVDER